MYRFFGLRQMYHMHSLEIGLLDYAVTLDFDRNDVT